MDKRLDFSDIKSVPHTATYCTRFSICSQPITVLIEAMWACNYIVQTPGMSEAWEYGGSVSMTGQE